MTQKNARYHTLKFSFISHDFLTMMFSSCLLLLKMIEEKMSTIVVLNMKSNESLTNDWICKKQDCHYNVLQCNMYKKRTHASQTDGLFYNYMFFTLNYLCNYNNDTVITKIQNSSCECCRDG